MRNLKTLVVTVGLILPAIMIWGQVIIPEPGPQDPTISLQNVRLISQDLNVSIKDQTAQVVVASTFHNPNNFQVEGTYLFTLPENVNVNKFEMTIAGKMVNADMVDIEKARKIYEEIVRKMRDPGILELVGYRAIRARIFPIAPSSAVTVNITYSQLLSADSNIVRFNAPYFARTIGENLLDKAILNLTLDSSTPIKVIYSPTHNIDVSRNGDKSAKVSFEATSYRSSLDFVLCYTVSEDTIGASILTYKEPHEDGYFIMMITAANNINGSHTVAKDIIFVVDRSGSMAGEKMRQAKDALKYCVKNLNSNDRFNIIDFATDTRMFESSLIEVTQANIERATSYIDNINAAGSTNIDEAVVTSLQNLAKEDGRVPLVFFVTDGLPTIGQTNYDQIIKRAGQANKSNARLFVFGVGHDVNTYLLDKLSEENKGARDYIQPNENIEEKVSLLYNKVSYPIFADVNLSINSISTFDIYPKQISDIFKGMQITLMGRYKGQGQASIELSGIMGKERKLIRYEVDFSQEKQNDYIPRLWAARKIAYLVDQVRLSGTNPAKEVVDEIVALGKKYGIVTPYTAFLITEDMATTAPSAVHDELEGARSKAAGSGRDRDVSDKAQQESQDLKKAKQEANAEYIEQQGEALELKLKKDGQRVLKTRRIGNKFFVLKDKTWIDSTFDEKEKDKITKIKFASDEYFKLIKDKAGIAKYLVLGENIIICLASEVYQIYSE